MSKAESFAAGLYDCGRTDVVEHNFRHAVLQSQSMNPKGWISCREIGLSKADANKLAVCLDGCKYMGGNYGGYFP